MTPRSGGTYALIRRAYGPYAGFVIGWVDWLSFAADLALKAVVILEFVAILVPEAANWRTPLAILLTSVFAVIQLRGIGLGALIQELATSLIGLVIFGLALLLIFMGAADIGTASSIPANNSLSDWSLLIATIIFTYDGWLYASYFSGEIRGGAGAVARSCIKGMTVVIVLYMLLNIALVKSVGLAALAGSDLALARALELAIHPAAGSIVVVAAIMILLSHQNLEYMGGPRILQALAVDGFASSRAQKVGKGGNPVFAIVITWLLAVGLILIGGFEFLLMLSVFLRAAVPRNDCRHSRPARAESRIPSAHTVHGVIPTVRFYVSSRGRSSRCSRHMSKERLQFMRWCWRQHPGLFFVTFHVLANATSHLSGLVAVDHIPLRRQPAVLRPRVWQLAPIIPPRRFWRCFRPRRNIRRGNCRSCRRPSRVVYSPKALEDAARTLRPSRVVFPGIDSIPVLANPASTY